MEFTVTLLEAACVFLFVIIGVFAVLVVHIPEGLHAAVILGWDLRAVTIVIR